MRIAESPYIAIIFCVPEQLLLDEVRYHSGRGGPRHGAGRPPGKNPPIHHVRRESIPKATPCHVTLKVLRGIPSLRNKRFVKAFRRSLQGEADRGAFRVVHFSIQSNHAHFLIEASDKRAMGNGMKSLAARFARAVNRVFRRSGKVLYGRYHLRALATPSEVRNALAYVLLNRRRHLRPRRAEAPVELDEASSGGWFDGWKNPVRRWGNPIVAEPRYWLLTTGWRRRGLIAPSEVPGR